MGFTDVEFIESSPGLGLLRGTAEWAELMRRAREAEAARTLS
jgi:hypothetical protein